MTEPTNNQFFDTFEEWVDTATEKLTAHPDFKDLEHGPEGYRGKHTKALCFDQLGRRCYNGGDFQRARMEEAFPVWFLWPDQVGPAFMAMGKQVADLKAQLEQLKATFGRAVENQFGGVLEHPVAVLDVGLEEVPDPEPVSKNRGKKK